MQGLRGAVAAAILFVLPAALLLWVLSALYAIYGQLESVQTVFGLLRPAVLAIIIAALVRMARHHLEDLRAWMLAAGAFVAIFFFAVPFPWIVIFALGLGLVARTQKTDAPAIALQSEKVRWSAVALLIALWMAPIVLAAAIFGSGNILSSLGLFFSKTALVTFGGAYAVLPYVAQHAVGEEWLSSQAMQDGLALAETTPGPLVIVLQFAGFFAGWNNATPLPPLAMATLGAAMTTWVTFLPSLIFILVGAPYVDRLTQSPRATAVLSTMGAMVVGVIASLAAWFATGVFAPGEDRVVSAVMAGVSLWLLVGRGWSIPSVVGIAAAAGVLKVLVV
jgi:chromate transporter